ncbi:MAG: glycosyltransferase family 39 protein [Anaerolineae bacterium]|nr:glycosyltransferase family 39 protein [Anaerolineae bacterium]
MSRNRQHALVCLLLLVSTALRLPSLDEPFGLDAGAHAYGAWLILRGSPLYTDFHPGHHLPGVYYFTALAFRLFGVSYFAAKVLVLLACVATVALVFALGKMMQGARVGLFAAYLFSLFTADPFMEGMTGLTELPANLFRVGCMVLLWRALRRAGGRRRAWLLVGSGALAACAFLFKAPYGLTFLVVVGTLLVEALRGRVPLRQRVARFAREGVLAACGFALVALSVAGYFHAIGALPDLLQVFGHGASYVDAARGLSVPVRRVIVPAIRLVLELWFLISLVLFTLLVWRRQRMLLRTVSVFALGWALSAFIEANVSGYPFRHYDLLQVPPLALLAGFALDHLSSTGKRSAWLNAAGVAVLIVAAPLTIYLRTYEGYDAQRYLTSYIGYKLGWFDRATYLIRAIGSDGLIALRSEVAGAYVREHTLLTDRVYQWPDRMSFYFVAQRICAVRYLWPNSLGHWEGYVPPTPRPEGWDYLRAQVFAAPATYIAIFDPATVPQWLEEGLAAHYELETEVMGVLIYRWARP